ncbi:MAG: AbrB/MazE/SpoVT family DNA-binding domain-containing protein [Thermoplasmata archaeon]|nr:AbrB/MazE/SpoVT family DNA-binding domain-containing protein [Candidatus Sysuiplasma acidicola]MDH2906056.1 AbrB/MazE/SpoVT family DNA-binding domain-containing protein [Methanomassiliicoccales archaeon]
MIIVEETVEVDKQGRLVIPVKLRRALHIAPGEHVILMLKNGMITLSKDNKEIRAKAKEWADTARKLSQKIGSEDSEESWKWLGEQYARRKIGFR